jgi:hypothetical protein
MMAVTRRLSSFLVPPSRALPWPPGPARGGGAAVGQRRGVRGGAVAAGGAGGRARDGNKRRSCVRTSAPALPPPTKPPSNSPTNPAFPLLPLLLCRWCRWRRPSPRWGAGWGGMGGRGETNLGSSRMCWPNSCTHQLHITHMGVMKPVVPLMHQVWESVSGLLAELDTLASLAEAASVAPVPYVRCVAACVRVRVCHTHTHVGACIWLGACVWVWACAGAPEGAAAGLFCGSACMARVPRNTYTHSPHTHTLCACMLECMCNLTRTQAGDAGPGRGGHRAARLPAPQCGGPGGFERVGTDTRAMPNGHRTH